MIKIIKLLPLIAVVGCSSAVGWGKPYEVTYKNERSISIKYDRIMSDMEDFAPIAEKHCAQYKKIAFPLPVNEGVLGYSGPPTQVFECRKSSE
jgi:hypothetical protein